LPSAAALYHREKIEKREREGIIFKMAFPERERERERERNLQRNLYFADTLLYIFDE